MPVDPGLGTYHPTRASQRFFRRWGIKGQLRSIWNTVVPVAVVDQWHADGVGSHRAISIQCNGNINEYPSCMFVTPTAQPGRSNTVVEIDAINSSVLSTVAMGNYHLSVHLMTPTLSYNPIQNLSPIGFYVPGLSTHPDRTWGNAVGLAGTNPAASPTMGFSIVTVTGSTNPLVPYPANTWVSTHGEYFNCTDRLDPPVRLYPGGALVLQWRHREALGRCYLWASFLYREYLEE